MRTGRVIAVLEAPLIAMSAAAGVAAQQVNPFARALLEEHNRARYGAGVPRLARSSKLAGVAQAWAEVLAREGRMRHASREVSGGAGENLWMGSAGYYGAEAMIGAFVDERRHYVHAEFPEISRTGKWQDVGHYTQIVWRDTR